MSTKMKWYGKGAKFYVQNLAWKRLVRASSRLIKVIKDGLSEQTGPPAAAPGKFPAIRSGELRKSIFRQEAPEIQTIRVGSTGLDNKKGGKGGYARYLEQGTRKMKRRPWLSLGLEKAKAAMKMELRRGRSSRK